MKLKIALLQMAGERFNPEANREKADRFCREAKADGADIALFPEMYNVAYPQPERFGEPEHAAQLKQFAEPVDGPFVSHFRKLAAELEMAIAVAYLESRNGGLRNSLTLIDRKGRVLGTYSKFHTCKFSNLEYGLDPGEDFQVWDLDTAAGVIKVGAMICYDREFPESARILMLKGAEIILVPNACYFEENRTNQLRTRSYENMLVCALTNYAAPNQNGASCICGFDGSLTTQGSRREEVLVGAVDIDALREQQRTGIWGISFRRPKDYKILTENIVRPGYGAKTARERAEAELAPITGAPIEKSGELVKKK